MISLKETVRLQGMTGRLALALRIAEGVFDDFGRPVIVTSVNDGQHMASSWHYRGEAADLKSKHLASQAAKGAVLNELKRRLIGFEVFLERPEQENEHFHLEPAP